MTDAEFVTELARRLNTFLEQSPERANLVLATPMPHAGYAGVAHFLGELGMPHGVEAATSKEDIKDALFLYPNVVNRKITDFSVVTGAELAEKAGTATGIVH
jgi:hypothetical protein